MRLAVSQLDYIKTAVHAVPFSSTRRQRDQPARLPFLEHPADDFRDAIRAA